MNQTNHGIILSVVLTVCLCALIGIITEAICVFYKIPDMNTQLASGFTHVVDTVIGALIAMLINTKAQSAATPADPQAVIVEQPPSKPIPTTDVEPPAETKP